MIRQATIAHSVSGLSSPNVKNAPTAKRNVAAPGTMRSVRRRRPTSLMTARPMSCETKLTGALAPDGIEESAVELVRDIAGSRRVPPTASPRR